MKVIWLILASGVEGNLVNNILPNTSMLNKMGQNKRTSNFLFCQEEEEERLGFLSFA